jgi:hypothetical protein
VPHFILFDHVQKAHPAFRCRDYRALLEKIGRHAIETARDGGFDRAEHCYLADPFGNRIELIAEEE